MARALGKPVYVIVYERSDATRDERIFGRLGTPLDPFQQFPGTDLKRVQGVIELLQAHLDDLTAERERFTPYLPMAAIAAYRRGELRLAAELEWHNELERILIEEAGATEATSGTQQQTPQHPVNEH